MNFNEWKMKGVKMEKLNQMHRLRWVITGGALAAALLVAACGGGGGGSSGGGSLTPTPHASLTPTAAPSGATLTISNGSGAVAFVGAYAPNITKIAGATPPFAEFLGDDYSNSHKPNIEYDIQIGAAGAVLSAYFWFTDASNNLTFFGCGGTTVPMACPSAMGYDPIMKQIMFNGNALSQVTYMSTNPAVSPTAVVGGATIKVGGYLQGP